jgi:hypothetical protein
MSFPLSLCMLLLFQAPGSIVTAFHVPQGRQVVTRAHGMSLKVSEPPEHLAGQATTTTTSTTTTIDRRSLFQRTASLVIGTTVVAAAAATTTPSPSHASGGATAGGVYLLSAKQRYNTRVKAGVQQLLVVLEDLKKDGSSSSKVAKTYFNTENIDTGSWKDLTAAGYLLSNAFRINSTASPDKIPAVKVRNNAMQSNFANSQGGKGRHTHAHT